MSDEHSSRELSVVQARVRQCLLTPGGADMLNTVAYIPFREERSDCNSVGGGDHCRHRGWPVDGFDDGLLWFVRLRAASLRGVGELLGRVRGVGRVVWRNHRARS